jgi:hypothetical protein
MKLKKPSLPTWAKKWKKDIQIILNKGIISPRLRYAIEEILKALNANNWELAYQLTAVKSLITGVINPKDKVQAFQEDHEANEKILGNSVYSILDHIHHDIAFGLDEMPSGSKTLHANGKTSEFKAKGIHPIVRRIQYEHRMIVKDVEKQDEERKWTPMTQARKVLL